MTRLYLFVLVVSHSAFVTTQSLVDHANNGDHIYGFIKAHDSRNSQPTRTFHRNVFNQQQKNYGYFLVRNGFMVMLMSANILKLVSQNACSQQLSIPYQRILSQIIA